VVGLVEIPRVRESGQSVDPQDNPPVGQKITAVVLGASGPSEHQALRSEGCELTSAPHPALSATRQMRMFAPRRTMYKHTAWPTARRAGYRYSTHSTADRGLMYVEAAHTCAASTQSKR